VRRAGKRAAGFLWLLASAGCLPVPRMCTSGGDCGGASSCVAGRCVARGAVPAISTARRVLYDPVEVGFVRRGGDPSLPAVVAMGGSDGALAFLRFAVPLPPGAGVIEAYLLLDRVTEVDSDPEPVALHVVRVIEPWVERSLSWSVQPRVEEVGSPVTRVLPASGALVRLDVRALVERWRRRTGADFGLAIVSDTSGGASRSRPRGMAFALAPGGGASWGDSGEASANGGRSEAARGPRLELYLR
jgi:hypothetical protein